MGAPAAAGRGAAVSLRAADDRRLPRRRHPLPGRLAGLAAVVLWAAACGGRPDTLDTDDSAAPPGAQRSQHPGTEPAGADALDADGLWLVVVNGLPVHVGADGEITAQTFIDCAIEAGGGGRADRTDHGHQPTRSRLKLGGKIMARDSAVFHLIPGEVERLVDAGGGAAWLRVRDPLQAGGHGQRCDVPLQLRPPVGGVRQRLRVVVETRLNHAWGCEVTQMR